MQTNLKYIGAAQFRAFEATVCVIPDCDDTIDPDFVLPICLRHTKVAFAQYAQLVADVAQPAVHEVKPRAPMGERMGHVYFVRVGDLIKIGWSGNVEQRLSHLNGDALLYSHPGTMADERATHALFDHLLDHGREWFRSAPDLLDFIADLRARAA